jgi:hypothetical protein
LYLQNTKRTFQISLISDDDCSGQDEQSVISSGKRKADDDKPLSRLSSMSKRVKIKEVCSDDVDQTLAEHVTYLLHNGMDEEQYNELTKDDVNGRPEHCTGLTVVRTNQIVWDLRLNCDILSLLSRLNILQKVHNSTILAHISL